MSTITKEWLLKTIAELEEERDAVPAAVNEDALMALAAMKIALASLEAESVAFRSKLKPPSSIGSEHWDYTDHRQPDAFELESCVIERLFTEPPAPVAVPDAMANDIDSDDHPLLWNYNNGWNACRAAMLQSFGNSEQLEPVTTTYKLPGDFDFERFNDVTWLECVASNPHMHSPTTSTIAMVALELNKRLEAGNSPVIPDCWVACSERMPDIGTEIFYFCQDDGLRDCGIVSSSNFSGKGDAELYVHAEGYDLRFGVDISHWMPLPASPQQK
ncbi:DUF551 domain-containing protein [Enterobacter kobei]|uniref:DUF551 domain-containing protein n=1 Tax=Enterobacter kobei TaxID=208224 RepID=UPI001C63E71F|nr:DUF551 domain-containing protein [Enterobacter kobei]MBW7591666.1 DUF551 domain-containing protein [Enterobacter kobei]